MKNFIHALITIVFSCGLLWVFVNVLPGFPTIKETAMGECISITVKGSPMDCSEKEKILEKTGGRYHKVPVGPNGGFKHKEEIVHYP